MGIDLTGTRNDGLSSLLNSGSKYSTSFLYSVAASTFSASSVSLNCPALDRSEWDWNGNSTFEMGHSTPGSVASSGPTHVSSAYIVIWRAIHRIVVGVLLCFTHCVVLLNNCRLFDALLTMLPLGVLTLMNVPLVVAFIWLMYKSKIYNIFLNGSFE